MKKRFIQTCLLVILPVLISAGVFASARAEEAPRLGDLNGDQATSAADAAVMLRALAFGRLFEEDRPDLDFTRNGEIDGTDARAILLYACGGIEDWISFGERVSSGLCDERLFDKFSYTGTKIDESGNYQSDTVRVTFTQGSADKSNYTLADIYIQDLTCFVTAFGSDEYRGLAEPVRTIFDGVDGAIAAINGDYYSIHLYGPVVRNGEEYVERITRDWDIALLLSSGELKVYHYGTLKSDEYLQLRVYQSWVFGPSLLDENGEAKTRFRSWVQAENPRSAIGYYEPGHYAFLTIDGRSSKSSGMTMQELSQLCQELGFVSAYNMDGGQSSVMYSRAGVMNQPYRNGRPVSDILAIREIPAE